MENLKIKLSEVISDSHLSKEEKLKIICEILDQEKSYFNWTGFYFKNGNKEELILGPYVGEPTDHTVIPFGRGICGQVAVSNQTFEVPDVMAEDNYLSCSIDTKAELVVPIIKNGDNIGQIDIDSHTINPFTKEDVELLEWLCDKVAIIL
ncbi:GAF domain-containing protein [Riemerella anatipestifer]|nr:GAF domain-containing protein [Riemerella anatipestifer]MDY3532531.1 GAF domain-containing protein [Riemerella anatipestifer]MDY3534914.1 GAF domain-containing protein [Riemerella anatipestifer]